MEKTYSSKKYEDLIYDQWEKSGFFNPDNLSDTKDSFTISMPPPNATGVLHTGHALTMAIEDCMTRYARMSGKKTLWLPGTDHASIATQTKVEKILAEKGKSRHDLGRERFLKEVDKFVAGSRNTIRQQIRKMGSSCDWSRERFTLDDGLSVAVKEAFVRMYNDGLIYRGDRIVNWCPRCHSTLADDEVEYEEQYAKFYTFKYDKNFPFSISTTRPETKLGDTAVAVSLKDKRYKKFIGQTIEAEFCGQKLKLKVITDRQIDPEFGTGALGVTPAHSAVDWQMAQEQDLEIKKVIDEDGKIKKGFGDFSGLSAIDARKKVIDCLKQQGLLEKEEKIDNKLSVCYRCGTAVEPLPSLQWFVAVDRPFKLKDKSKLGWTKNEATLKELALHVVRSGRIKIIPKKFEKTYFHWMENLRDWCISRQIWYGHRIPVYKKGKEVYVGDKPSDNGWIQEEDTLDTWFSSALWTFSTLGWPDSAKATSGKAQTGSDLDIFHPTTVMETGYDILFFWVARMIIMTAYCLNDIPFKTVYLHGMVRDENNKKMSKSLGNAVDPIQAIEEFGTDALRMSMIMGNTPGNDVKLFDEKLAGNRNFVNKLWNIARFVLTNLEETRNKKQETNDDELTLADQAILAKMKKLIDEVKDDMDNYQLSQAGEKLYEFTWSEFADWYLEISKVENNPAKNTILEMILKDLLKLWHPFIPFVTEAIWQELDEKGYLMIAKWPEKKKYDNLLPKKSHIDDYEKIKQIIKSIRNLRSEKKIEPGKFVNVSIVSQKDADLYKSQAEVIKALARCENIDVLNKNVKDNQTASISAGEAIIHLHLAGLVDINKEKARLTKELKEAQDYILGLEKKLANKEFISNAPAKVVEKEKEKLLQVKEKEENIKKQIAELT